jgi:hypothetical protein
MWSSVIYEISSSYILCEGVNHARRGDIRNTSRRNILNEGDIHLEHTVEFYIEGYI